MTSIFASVDTYTGSRGWVWTVVLRRKLLAFVYTWNGWASRVAWIQTVTSSAAEGRQTSASTATISVVNSLFLSFERTSSSWVATILGLTAIKWLLVPVIVLFLIVWFSFLVKGILGVSVLPFISSCVSGGIRVVVSVVVRFDHGGSSRQFRWRMIVVKEGTVVSALRGAVVYRVSSGCTPISCLVSNLVTSRAVWVISGISMSTAASALVALAVIMTNVIVFRTLMPLTTATVVLMMAHSFWLRFSLTVFSFVIVSCDDIVELSSDSMVVSFSSHARVSGAAPKLMAIGSGTRSWSGITSRPQSRPRAWVSLIFVKSTVIKIVSFSRTFLSLVVRGNRKLSRRKVAHVRWTPTSIFVLSSVFLIGLVPAVVTAWLHRKN